MFKDEFVLKKNSWHARLMYFTWKLRPTDFSHMCPYFWISFFNILIIPFTGTFFILKKIAVFLVKLSVRLLERLDAYLAEKALEWDRKQIEELKRLENESKIFNKIASIDFDRWYNKKYKKLYHKILYEHDDLYNIISRARSDFYAKKHEERQRKEAEKRVRKEIELAEIKQVKERVLATIPKKKKVNTKPVLTNKQYINLILKKIEPVVKTIFYIMISSLLAVGAYFLFVLLKIIYTSLASVPSSTYKSIGYYTLAGLGCLALVFFLGYLIYTLYTRVISRIRIRFKKPIIFKYIANGFNRLGRVLLRNMRYIYYNYIYRYGILLKKSTPLLNKLLKIILFPFKILIQGIISFVKGVRLLFFVIIRMVKDQCPAIKWVDNE